MLMDEKINIAKIFTLSKAIYYFDAMSIKTPMASFTELP